MDIQELEFVKGSTGEADESPIAVFSHDLLDHSRNWRDLNGERVLVSAELGLTFPLAAIDERATPRLRLWFDGQGDNNPAVSYFQDDTNVSVSIFIELFSQDGRDIQLQRQRLVESYIRSLESLDNRLDDESIENGTQRIWIFPNPMITTIEHVNVFHKIMGLYPVTPPHYVTRIGLTVNGIYT